MEEVIIVTGFGFIFLLGIIGAPKISQKQEELKAIKAVRAEEEERRARAEAWKAELEYYRQARESHIEDYVPGSVELPTWN